ncbi:MAG TPA: SUMF1/EgtB/PvdO family nonheme iron enzyme [Candidatus Marinimicrobia bacterium]|nr:SUMF1/EgtB/PvdO family nonheme iron enzyme [Candidatus Neomarinimicrobiota bacterium]HQE95112.1 SUMF1/EgtB/PvdO family nonheme iron enzyme [Candidatus Neomarinimicrobiota bacterium]
MKKSTIITVSAVLIALAMTMPLWANHVVLENVSLTEQNTTDDYTHIEFDISWENSWRLDGVAAPNNWDAAWVFAKYNIVGDDPDVGWKHCTLNTSGHTAPTGSVVENPTSDNSQTGVFIYRSADNKTTEGNAASVDWDNAKLRWNYGTDGIEDGAIVDVKVFAIEMVYIPQGEFHLFNGESGNFYAEFNSGNTISSEDAIGENTITWIMKDTYCGAGTSDGIAGYNAALGVNYPKGFKAIYCMKYEISQGQYADFLSLLTDAQDDNRYPNANGSYRHTISGSYGSYSASRPDRACNWISWADGLAYADWAGLRPMTELEYEKICRGPETAGIEYAWGNTTITAATTISGTENGTEIITNPGANCCYSGQTFTGGDKGKGPLRCGIFATGSSSRQQSGASYYGVMELSGNLWERYITVAKYCSNGSTWIETGVSSFDGRHGDGVLTTNGFADVTNWPSPTVTSGNTAFGSSFRGGDWSGGAAGLCVSDRYSAAAPYAYRRQYDGFRLSRTQ